MTTNTTGNKAACKAAEIANEIKSKATAVAQDVQDKWNSKTPGEKARFVTTTVVLTMVSPFLPVIWGATYAASSARKGEDK